MRSLFTLLILFVFANVSAQSKFEIGYYIDQSGNKFDGEIAELALQNFPSDIKIRKRGVVETISVGELAYIQYGTLIFEKKSFEYDPSARLDISNFSKEKEFNLVNKTAFLQLLVNGEFKLYKYLENGVATYFYEISAQKLTTLKYKKYVEHAVDIKENKEFINQLINDVQGESSFKEGYYDALKYNDSDLIEYFTKINGKNNTMKGESKLLFNFFAGYSSTTLNIKFIQDFPTNNYQHITVMPELEYVLNNNLMDPTSFYLNLKYRSFKSNYEEIFVRENWYHEVEYQALLLGVGVKKYFLSSANNKFYGKLGIGIDMPIKSNIISPPESLVINPIYLNRGKVAFTPGVGLKLFKSLLVEVNYDYVFDSLVTYDNTSLTFKLGYTF